VNKTFKRKTKQVCKAASLNYDTNLLKYQDL